MFEHWYSFCHQMGLSTPKLHVIDLVEYLDFLQISHDFSDRKLYIHASATCIILQPINQMRALTAPIEKLFLKGAFRKNTPSIVLAEIWDIKKLTDLLQSWVKPSALDYTCLTLKTLTILVMATDECSN